MRPVFSLLFLLVAAVISGEASTRPVSSPDDAAMIRIAVADALRSGEFDRADKLLHDPKIANSNNWKDQVWRGEALNILGRHAWREGRIAEAEVRLGDAEAAFRRAIELERSGSGSLCLAGRVLFRAGPKEVQQQGQGGPGAGPRPSAPKRIPLGPGEDVRRLEGEGQRTEGIRGGVGGRSR